MIAMRIYAVPFTLLALSVGTVSATPAKKETVERVSYSDVADDGRTEPTPDAEGWVEVFDPTPAKHGEVFVTLGASAGRFTLLRLEASKGRPYVRSIRIDFTDGSRRVVRVGKTLGKRPVYVDLGGPHEIRQIMIDGDRRTKGLYTLHAAPDDATGIVATR